MGKWGVGEAFPWREGLQECLLCLWIIPFHVWIHEIQRGSSSSALTAKGTKPTPHRGIPTAFPEFLQSSAKLPLSIKITGERIFFLISICPRNLKESKIEGKALPSRKAPNPGREENPSSHQHQIQKYTSHGNIPLLGEVRPPGNTGNSVQIQAGAGTPQSPSWMR